VTNLAQRLCAHASRGQILISQRVLAATEEIVVAEPVGELALPGFARPTRAYSVLGLNAARTTA
jgi:class 3 adenylate cyclase